MTSRWVDANDDHDWLRAEIQAQLRATYDQIARLAAIPPVPTGPAEVVEVWSLEQSQPLLLDRSSGHSLDDSLDDLRAESRRWQYEREAKKARAAAKRRTNELRRAREDEHLLRGNVLRREADIRRWPSDRAGRIRANAAAGFALVGAASFGLVGLLPVALLCMVVVVIATFFKPRQRGRVRGTQGHLQVLVAEWEDDVDEHGEALTRLRLAEASVPVHEAFPELFPDGAPRLPE